MRMAKLGVVVTLSLSVSGCVTNPDRETFCGRAPLNCVAVGVLAVAVLGLVVLEGAAGGASGPPSPSDQRLKRDIHPVGALANGLPLYSFRYWNDNRIFVGIMAQDLLKDARFRHAVSRSARGFYLVDFRALGLGITGDAAQFQEAGRHALGEAEATPIDLHAPSSKEAQNGEKSPSVLRP